MALAHQSNVLKTILVFHAKKDHLFVLTLSIGPGISTYRKGQRTATCLNGNGVPHSAVSFPDRKETEQSWHLGHTLWSFYDKLISAWDQDVPPVTESSLFGDKMVKLPVNYVLPSVNMSRADCHSPSTLGKLVCLVWTASNIPHYWIFFSPRSPAALSHTPPLNRPTFLKITVCSAVSGYSL